MIDNIYNPIEVIKFQKENGCMRDVYDAPDDTLYHFTRFERFKNIWEEQKLDLGHREDMNDCAEVDFDVIGNDESTCRCLEAIYDYKQLSFSKPKDKQGIPIYYSPCMWGLYSNKCKGVCIEFKKERLKIDKRYICGNIRYTNKFTNFMELSEGQKFKTKEDAHTLLSDRKVQREVFFRKTNDWKFENEYRVISKYTDSLSIKDAISRVFIFRMEKSNYDELRAFLPSNIEIKHLTFHTIGSTKRLLWDIPASEYYEKYTHLLK